ncbi:MAG: methyltransferase domain-containing protein [Candidatus Saccharimonadales bacterium]
MVSKSSSVLHSIGGKIPVLKNIINENRNLATDRGVLQLEKGNLEAQKRELAAIAGNPRNFLAHQYLSGHGIEIGAAHLPVSMPMGVKVTYVDVFSADDLRKVFPREYAKVDIVEVDVVDDGETLTKFKSNSLDFIVANHFIEHCLDPIGTILNMYKKLRKNGVLYMAVPDKRLTFDKPRPITAYSHLLEEHKDKTKMKFRKTHTEEAIRLTDKTVHKAGVEKRVQEILDSGFRIHYHVWTQKEMAEMFVRLAHDFHIDLEIEAQLKNQHEVIFVLRKQPA